MVRARSSRLLIGLLSIVPPSMASSQNVLVTVDSHQMPWDPRMNNKLPFGIDDGALPKYVFGHDIVPGSLIRISATGTVHVSGIDAAGSEQDVTKPAPTRDRFSADDFRGADQLSSSELSALDPFRPKRDHATGAGMNATATDIFRPDGRITDRNAPHAVTGSWGPEGQPSQISNAKFSANGVRFPSYYVNRRYYSLYVNELIGCFVDAEGGLVSYPFPIGKGITVRVPAKAAGLALGLNADSYSANQGTFQGLLEVTMPSVKVIDDK